MHAIRIIVNNTAALDSATELTQSTADVVQTYDADLGLQTYTLGAGVVFGAFEPGKLIGAGTPGATYNLISCSLVPAVGEPAAGSRARIAAPPLPSAAVRLRDIVLLDTNAGLFNAVLEPLPISHKLAFFTPDAGGPWVLDCSFERLYSAEDFLELTATPLS